MLIIDIKRAGTMPGVTQIEEAQHTVLGPPCSSRSNETNEDNYRTSMHVTPMEYQKDVGG